MKRILIAGSAVFAALTLAMGPASADGQPPSDDATPKAGATRAAAPAGEKRYCVIDTVTGTRIAKKVCKTRKEWMSEGFDPLNP